MKKRRELDALVNGKSGTGRRKKKGQHELLRNDTDSSDVEEFAIPDKTVVRKRSGASRFCSTCVAVTSFFLLTACIITIGGLVWVHIDLKREVDQLRSDLNRVESGNQGNPKEFHELHSSVKDLQDNQSLLKSSIKSNKENISDIFKQLLALNATTQSLSSSLASASELRSLPNDVQTLTEQLANMGSNVEELKTAKETFQAFKDTTSKQLLYFQSNLTLFENLHKKLESLNGSLSTEINSLIMNTSDITNEIRQNNSTINFILHQITDLNASPNGAVDALQIRAMIGEELKNLTLKTNSNGLQETTRQISQMREDFLPRILRVENKTIGNHEAIQEQKEELTKTMFEKTKEIESLQRQIDALNSTLKELILKTDTHGLPTPRTEKPSSSSLTPDTFRETAPTSNTRSGEAAGKKSSPTFPPKDTIDAKIDDVESPPGNNDYEHKDDETTYPYGS